MAAQKLPNSYSPNPGSRILSCDACLTPLAGGGRVIDIHALNATTRSSVIFAGAADGHPVFDDVQHLHDVRNSRYSPGLILMRSIVDHWRRARLSRAGLGNWIDDYKRLFCKNDESIFDCFIPLSLRGRVAAGALSGINRTKRLVKHNQALFHMAQKLRSAFHR